MVLREEIFLSVLSEATPQIIRQNRPKKVRRVVSSLVRATNPSVKQSRIAIATT
jgi:hypothetical protein